MNINLKKLKEEITARVEVYNFIGDAFELKKRILDVLKNFLHLRYSHRWDNRDSLLENLGILRELLGDINERQRLRHCVDELERSMVDFLVTELGYNIADEFNQAYEAAKAKAKEKCTSVFLQEILIDYIKKNGESALNFSDFWTVCLERIFTSIFCLENSLFIQNFCLKFICEDSISKYQSLPNIEKAYNLIILLCSNNQDLKFLHRANEVYTKISSNSGEIQHREIDNGIEIMCKFCPPYAVCTPNTICPQRAYQMSSRGLNIENTRNDGLVLFGKHKFADIIFPENSRHVEDLALAIYSDGNNFEMIDCSKSSKSSVMFNMIPYVKYPIHEDSIFDIATKTLIHIKAKQNYEYENSVHSKLLFEHAEGFYSNAIEKEKCIATYSRYKNTVQYSFILGRGGLGIPVDIFCLMNDYTGRRHLKFLYENDNWYIIDLKSKNRTYFFLKDFNQRKNKEHSKIFPVFTEYELDEEGQNESHDTRVLTLNIGHFVFLIKPIKLRGLELQ